MAYKLVPCADSFFIVDVRDVNSLSEAKYPSAYIRGTFMRTEAMADGRATSITEPVIGAREFAERLVAALNEVSAPADHLAEDDSANLEAAETDEWISWGGGECPVPESAVVDVRYNGGDQSSGETAGNQIWRHQFNKYNIVAYRVVQMSQQAAE